jgi:hypothetical protein
LLPICPEGSAAAPAVATSSPKLMTLLAAAQSLQLIELVGVSWINVHPRDAHHIAEFTVALLLPFMDPALSSEFRAGGLRFWPDQTRLLESQLPVREQIDELHESGVLGDLAFAYRRRSWMIKTHAGHELERRSWLRAVIALEGRRPVVYGL